MKVKNKTKMKMNLCGGLKGDGGGGVDENGQPYSLSLSLLV